MLFLLRGKGVCVTMASLLGRGREPVHTDTIVRHPIPAYYIMNPSTEIHATG